ncbi:MAG: neutral/alkaline non-lysosomal ceramidase N-terminal domain-containing protein [Bryobacteraceae bacterium]
MTRILLPILISLSISSAFAAGFKAGVARIDITPKEPIWMSGYASRKQPSQGVAQRLWAKALAIEDNKGGRVVIVTTDLIGLPGVLSDVVAARAMKQFGLDRSGLLLNSSHTHTGPVVRPNLITMYDLDERQERAVREYSQDLTDKLVGVIGAALGKLAPAEISYGQGETDFAMNRREFTPKGVRIGVNPKGPMDHTVPVVRISKPDGTLHAVLFGYACHNTTLTGDFYELSGDYAGFAQSEVEGAHPGATALFLMLCGGDQNPHPRGTLDLARKHGSALAAEVDRVLKGKLDRVRGPVRGALQMTQLAFAPHTREQFEKLKDDPNPAKARLAEAMLKAYDERRPVQSVQYPVQAVRLGRDLTILGLGGEVVVEYALRAKKEYPKQKLIVAGYSNDVMCYIPSRRMIAEGGYEVVDSMIYYGKPGPFTEEVEDTVFTAIRSVMKRVGN